eukprot:2738911-Ditylum_brightwellii.AAC.1
MACYDQMIPEVTALYLQSLGLPSEATKCSVLLNHNMTRYIKTSKGIFNNHYKHTSEYRKLGKDKAKRHLRQIGCFNHLRFSTLYMLLSVAYFSLASVGNL